MKRSWRRACIFALFITGVLGLFNLIYIWEENHDRYASSKDLTPNVETWTRLSTDEMSEAVGITLSTDFDSNQFISRWHYASQDSTNRLIELLRERGYPESRHECQDQAQPACLEIPGSKDVLQFTGSNDAGKFFYLISVDSNQVAVANEIPFPRFSRSP